MRITKAFIGTIFFSIALSVMPALASADTYYTVKSGDSLWKIARSFNISIEQIKEYNSINLDIIFPGQSLLVKKDGGQSDMQTTEVSRGTSRVDAVINYAKSFIGAPYRYAGESPRGFDCSGYVRYVFEHFGIDLPHSAREQFHTGRRVSLQEAEPGDIVAFTTGKYITHSGIYLGGGKFISSTSSCGVEITSIKDPYWSEHFFGFSRIVQF